MKPYDASMRRRARRMRANGATYPVIASRLGIALGTAKRWCNPDLARRDREHSLAAKRKRKTPCPDCGRPVDYMRPGQPCDICKHEREFGARNRLIVALWNEGKTAPEIAAVTGLTEANIQTSVDGWRASGRYELILHRRRSRTDWGRIERMWNHERKSSAEIAEALGDTEGNISRKVYMMRRAGIEMEYRAPRRDAVAA